MSKSKKTNKTKNIPVLKRKHIPTVEVPVLKLDDNDLVNLTSDSPEFRAAVSKAVTESISKAIPSIIEEVLKELQTKSQ